MVIQMKPKDPAPSGERLMRNELPIVVSLKKKKKTGRGLMSLLRLDKGSLVTSRECPERISDGCDT